MHFLRFRRSCVTDSVRCACCSFAFVYAGSFVVRLRRSRWFLFAFLLADVHRWRCVVARPLRLLHVLAFVYVDYVGGHWLRLRCRFPRRLFNAFRLRSGATVWIHWTLFGLPFRDDFVRCACCLLRCYRTRARICLLALHSPYVDCVVPLLPVYLTLTVVRSHLRTHLVPATTRPVHRSSRFRCCVAITFLVAYGWLLRYVVGWVGGWFTAGAQVLRLLHCCCCSACLCCCHCCVTIYLLFVVVVECLRTLRFVCCFLPGVALLLPSLC